MPAARPGVADWNVSDGLGAFGEFANAREAAS
jgi:hypothetical protein